MPLSDYLIKEVGVDSQTPISPVTTRPPNQPTAPTTPLATERRSLFRFIGDQLIKPVGVATAELEGLGNFIGNILSIASPKVMARQGITRALESAVKGQQAALDVIAGKKKLSFSQRFKEIGATTPLDRVFGIGGDLFIDPLNINVGLIAKAAKLTRAREIIQPVTTTIRETPAVQKLISFFSNTTGNKEFDAIVDKFRNLRSFREGELLDAAVQLQKNIKKMGAGAEELITDALENPRTLAAIKDPNIRNTVLYLQTTYKNLLDTARQVGLSVGEIQYYAPHIRTKESFLNHVKQAFGLGTREFGTAGIEKGRKLLGTIQELGEKGIDIFEVNPAIQLAKKGLVYAKAITSKEFASAVAKFAVSKGGVEVTNPLLKEMRFLPQHAAVIDNFYSGIKPPELKTIVKGFDEVQNLWKSQALVSPAYHIRNIAGNLWNNYLAGINPAFYAQALVVQMSKKVGAVIKEAKQLGVINEGWYAADIADEIAKRVKTVGNLRTAFNPLSRNNLLLRLNRRIGTVVENNARLAHYLSKKSEGLTVEQAARSVKKYLFDYTDLTDFERNILKRAIPFYTWTRKNLPLQLEALIKQPQKVALPVKIINQIESGVEKPNEKYMSAYIEDNIPVRIRKNKERNTEYFLLGNWLPYAQAIDVLSQPLTVLVEMTTPLVKTPLELFSNRSTFFKTTFGEPAPIERRYKQQGEFLGRSMRRRNITLLRNIRILNDLNKWYDKQDPTAVKDSWIVKLLNTLFGKTATYDVQKAKYFYDLDTKDRIDELIKAIRDADRRGFEEKADQLRKELRDVRIERR